MKTILIDEIEQKRQRLLDVYEYNDQLAVHEAVIEASQELDRLIIEYLMNNEAKRGVMN